MNQSGLEQSRQIMLRSMLTAQLPYGVYMVHLWMMHGLQGRVIIKQHGPCVIYINRVAIQQRLLVEFSYDLHIDSLLRALLACVIIGLCVQWLPQRFDILLLNTRDQVQQKLSLLIIRLVNYSIITSLRYKSEIQKMLRVSVYYLKQDFSSKILVGVK